MGGDEVPSLRMVVVEILEKIQQPSLPLEIPSSFRHRVPAIRLARRVDRYPRAVPQVRGQVSVSRLVVVVSSVAKVRIDRRAVHEAYPFEKTSGDSQGGISTTQEKKRSFQGSQDRHRKFGQIDIQKGPAIGWPASLSWIRRIVRVFFYRVVSARACLHGARILEKHADSIEAKLDRGDVATSGEL